MKPTIKRLHEAAMSATNGAAAYDAVRKLTQAARKGDQDAKACLSRCMLHAPMDHIRGSACYSLAELVNASDRELASTFEEGLEDDATRYWCILGYANILGPEAYGKLIAIARDGSLTPEDRGRAVKCLASCSGQPFDRQLPSDPGEWREQDLRLDEIVAWSQAGCPDGAGYPSPVRHPALDDPASKLEQLASRLDKRLAKQRTKRQDPADLRGWLVVADAEDIDRINSRWKLPSVYLDFLTRFSPVKVTLESRRFWNGGLQLFGAAELIQAQEGYAVHPLTQKPIRGWPKGHVVIASHGGDPFVLDLSSSDGHDAPVLTAPHGGGKWAFEQVAESFQRFLQSLAK